MVDDEPLVQDSFSAMLRALGFEVFCAASGPQALEMYRQTDFSLLLVDMHMPEMDGNQVLEALTPFSSCRVVVVSGAATAAQIRRARELGADCFLGKPFTVADLREAVGTGLT